MSNAPVLIPTLCRFQYFKQCIESLKNNTLSDETEIYIGVDYPTRENHWEGYNKIKGYVKNITGFKRIHVYIHKENLGSIKNTNFLLEKARQEHEKYILSEDDNIFSKYFLLFMNRYLNEIKNNDEIIGVCGYSYPFLTKYGIIPIIQGISFSAWGYAMWFKNRSSIEEYIYNGEILNAMKNREIRKKVKLKSTYNYNLLMSACRANPRNKCKEYFTFTDLAISAYMLINDKNVIMPSKSLVRNCGWDGSGEHCGEKSRKERIPLARYEYSEQPICSNDEMPMGNINIINKEMIKDWNDYTKTEEKYKYMKNKIRTYIYLLLGDDLYHDVKIFFEKFHHKEV